MSNIKKLKIMVETELLPEVENFIKKLEVLVEGGIAQEEDEEVLEETLELRTTFETILEDIAAGEMDDEEALDILKELKKINKKK
jgi:hypothetical protein